MFRNYITSILKIMSTDFNPLSQLPLCGANTAFIERANKLLIDGQWVAAALRAIMVLPRRVFSRELTASRWSGLQHRLLRQR